MRTGLLALALAGCASTEDATLMEGFSYAWVGANHRVSHLTFGVDDADAVVAVVGGTSTTGLDPELPATCDEDTCEEFAFTDRADISIRWARVTESEATFATQGVALIATAEGTEQSVEVDLARKAKGDAQVVIRQWSLDTDHALSGGDACYNPAYGWHPRRLQIAADNVALASDGKSVTFDLHAAFEAGNSLETERECVDAVNEQAQVPLTVQVLVVAGEFAADSATQEQSASYTYGCSGTGLCISPDPQPDPDWTQRAVDFDLQDPVFGWSALDFGFHVDDPDQRGAYLRTLTVFAEADTLVAAGHATNFSPGTQLSGFEYEFTGTVIGMDLGAVERGTIEQQIEIETEDDGSASLQRFPL